MTNIKKGFKVCRIEKNHYISCFEDGSVIKYKKRIWTKRPKGCGPLAVFDKWGHALSFFKDFSLVTKNILKKYPDHSGAIHSIIECEYIESENKYLYSKDKHKYRHDLPLGTMFADKVKLIL